MGKREMTSVEVRRIERRGLTHVGGCTGLGVNVGPTGAKSWILRVVVGSKRRDIGLGSFTDVSLAQARESGRAARAMVAQGIDPIEHAKQLKSALIASQLSAVTFDKAARDFIEAHESSWRSAKHAAQWRSTLERYALPSIGKMLVRDVALPHVLAILTPIWHSRTETAVRLRARIEAILDAAAARGLRSGLNPARWKGHLDTLLPSPGRIAGKTHHRALPFAQVPAFMAKLVTQNGTGARALEFLVLTAARSGEVRFARASEFDLDLCMWTVPAQRMKAGKEHRVPLSPRAVEIVKSQLAVDTTDEADPLIFASARGRPLSDMTLAAVLKRMEVNGVPHGFRSSFRDFCAEETDFPHEIAEMALAHAVKDKVVAAYLRSDLFDRRRLLMSQWEQFTCNATRA